MGNFNSKLQGFMAGRYGADQLNTCLMVTAIVLIVINFFIGSIILSILSFAALIWACFRAYSRNIAKRSYENAAFLKLTAKPRKSLRIADKKYKNRKTTKYVKCKCCGKTLSVPKGKGKIRITCPICENIIETKS